MFPNRNVTVEGEEQEQQQQQPVSQQEGGEVENLGSFYMGRTRVMNQPERKLPPGVLTATILIVFAGILWYAYPSSDANYSDMDVPTVKADTSPVKAQPDSPGGMEVRHQDSTVFDPMEKKADAPEKLLPAAETPVNKEAAIPSTPTVAATEDITAVMKPKKTEKLEAPAAAAVEPVKETVKPVETKKAEVKKEVTPKAAPAAVEKGNLYIQLGAYHDEAGAGKDWTKLKGKYPELLGKLSMRTQKVNVPGKGTFYRLQAGKLSDKSAADICSSLKKAGAACVTVKN